jgi:hypothetical protein
MGDTCLSASALTFVSGIGGLLVTAIVALYRGRIAGLEREAERWERLANSGNAGWAEANHTARRARSEPRS